MPTEAYHLTWTRAGQARVSALGTHQSQTDRVSDLNRQSGARRIRQTPENDTDRCVLAHLHVRAKDKRPMANVCTVIDTRKERINGEGEGKCTETRVLMKDPSKRVQSEQKETTRQCHNMCILWPKEGIIT